MPTGTAQLTKTVPVARQFARPFRIRKSALILALFLKTSTSTPGVCQKSPPVPQKFPCFRDFRCHSRPPRDIAPRGTSLRKCKSDNPRSMREGQKQAGRSAGRFIFSRSPGWRRGGRDSRRIRGGRRRFRGSRSLGTPRWRRCGRSPVAAVHGWCGCGNDLHRTPRHAPNAGGSPLGNLRDSRPRGSGTCAMNCRKSPVGEIMLVDPSVKRVGHSVNSPPSYALRQVGLLNRPGGADLL